MHLYESLPSVCRVGLMPTNLESREGWFVGVSFDASKCDTGFGFCVKFPFEDVIRPPKYSFIR